MSSHATPWPPPARLGEPVWEIAEFFPEQGRWTENQYLALTTNRLVEFDNGIIEVLPLPTKTHQMIVLFLRDELKAYLVAHLKTGSLVLVAPYRLRIPTGKYREPDVLYMTAEQNSRSSEDFTALAEIVMEVVSKNDPERDYIAKRADYAAAGVPEYWIVDREDRSVLVLRLDGNQYAEHGVFRDGQVVTSSLLVGFQISVDELLNQGV